METYSLSKEIFFEWLPIILLENFISAKNISYDVILYLSKSGLIVVPTRRCRRSDTQQILLFLATFSVSRLPADVFVTRRYSSILINLYRTILWYRLGYQLVILSVDRRLSIIIDIAIMAIDRMCNISSAQTNLCIFETISGDHLRGSFPTYPPGSPLG